jgi:isopentenyl-diphosphate delta-isomerase
MDRKTESRKKDHVELVLKEGAQYGKTNGLERHEFLHNALPELDFNAIDLSSLFLGKELEMPLMITGMTGGYKDAEEINKDLAQAAEKHGLMFGLGSQRAMLEQPELKKTYYVRDVAPKVFLVSNIGAYQLKKYATDQIAKLVSDTEADVLAIHLNPLQEIIQPEGDRDFSNILEVIGKVCEKVSEPVIVKETGAGISAETAFKLKQVGVKAIDVSGAGGTSWSAVEYLRGGKVPGFEDWGIPTAEAVKMCKGILPLIASGGVRNGIEAAKCLALGADVAGAAYPFLKAQREGRLDEELAIWEQQLKICAFLTGSKTLADLKKARLRQLF